MGHRMVVLIGWRRPQRFLAATQTRRVLWAKGDGAIDLDQRAFRRKRP